MKFVEPIRYRKKIAQIKNQLRGQGRYLFTGTGKSVVAAAAMGAVVVWWLSFSTGYSVWIVCRAGILLGGAVFAASMLLLRVEEVQEILGSLRRLAKRISG